MICWCKKYMFMTHFKAFWWIYILYPHQHGIITESKVRNMLSILPFLLKTRDWTQEFFPVTSSGPLKFFYFLILRQGLTKSLSFPGWASTCKPPASAPQNSGDLQVCTTMSSFIQLFDAPFNVRHCVSCWEVTDKQNIIISFRALGAPWNREGTVILHHTACLRQSDCRQELRSSI